MRKHHIVFSPKENHTYRVNQVTDMLATIGITSSGGSQDKQKNFVLKFEGRLSDTQRQIISIYIGNISLSENGITFVEAPHVFDFENYMDTDLNGMAQEIGIDAELDDIDLIIDKVLDGETTEFKQQARKAVAELWKIKIENWLFHSMVSAR